ncbi:diguanylate cyclase [Aquisalimonas lutea]|uniref:diguanylate cyclase domain-containing protein n=1 Tax=Aquisalimonas lutea TaxID=1327750 RepID=UPI0025B420A9|nr:diguanylate cyclase [Aquisalimonas lutea]MDN3518687.1 diguanylate cyclase [Aquisalimonas lutea]
MTYATNRPETRRIQLMRQLGALDERTMRLFRSITALAARLGAFPLASISLADEPDTRYYASVGFPDRTLPRAETFCSRVLARGEFVHVPDARRDPQFRDTRPVTGGAAIRSYAGAPIAADDGTVLGALCMFDRQPRDDLGALGEQGLTQLAAAVSEHLRACLRLHEADELRRIQTEQEQILDAFARTSHSGYSLADRDGVILRISGFTSHIMGYAPEDLVGSDLTTMVPDSLKATVRAQHAAVIDDGRTRSGVWKVTHREGGFRYMHICGERIFTAGGDPLVFSSITDVTDDHLRTRLRNERSRLLEQLARDRSTSDVLDDLLGGLSRYVSHARAVVVAPEDHAAGILSAPHLTARQRELMEELLRLPGSLPEAMRGRDWLAATPDLQASRTYTGADIAREAGWHAMIWYPLRHPDGRHRGAVGIVRDTAGSFTDAETELLADLVALVSTLLETGTLLERMDYQAHHDILTGLANRRLLRERTAQAVQEAERTGHPVAVFMLDLDNFKMINDSLGHDAGDELLTEVANRLRRSARDDDTVARLGGDEFVVLAPGTGREDAARLAEGMMEALRHPIALASRSVAARPSIGIALAGADGRNPDTLLSAADAAMYAAKASGRNCYRFHGNDLDRPIATRFRLQQELYQATVETQIVTEAQPRVDAQGRLVALEFLSTWHHPEEGRIRQDTLWQLAEETGRLRMLEKVMAEEITRVLPEWRQHHPGLIVTARLAEITLHDRGFPDRLAAYLERTGLPPERLEADITRAVASQDEALLTSIQTLVTRFPGIRLAVSSIGERSVPFLDLVGLGAHTGKLSPLWLTTLEEGSPLEKERARGMVTQLTRMAEAIGMTMVIEGVETRAQWDLARELGVHEFQGPLFAASCS